MVCNVNRPVYANPPFRGIRFVGSRGDGYTIDLRWHKAWAKPNTWLLVYNLYYSTIKEDVFTEGVKVVITNGNKTTVGIAGLKPGDVYYFAVRAALFEPNTVYLSGLPTIDGEKIYPEAALRFDIAADSVLIPVEDVDLFPVFGTVQIGGELIGYTNVDLADGYLVTNLTQRGLYGTEPRAHTVDGYDGYLVYDNPLVRHFHGWEDDNTNIQLDENKFEHQYPVTIADGYKEKKNLVQSESAISAQDDANDDLASWDHAGWRRTHIPDLLAGKCLGSYYGGEYYCADGYEGVGRQLRGLSFDDLNNQREELLIETTGLPCMLLRRMTSGKVSKHYDSSRENITHRGSDTFGTDLVVGYDQFFNPKRSDGKILVRFGPTREEVERREDGLENVYIPDCWTLTYPTLKDGDVIVRFDKNGNEEFRYEVHDVTRNYTLLEGTGAQKFVAHRVRVTDPIRQIKIIDDTSTLPTSVSTSIGMVPGLIPPHVHNIVVNEGIVTLSQVTQTTSVAQGHNHEVINGVVQEVLGHTHTIVLP